MSINVNFNNGEVKNNEGELVLLATLPNMVSLNRTISVLNGICNSIDDVIMFSGKNGSYFMTKENQELYYSLDDYFCGTSVSEFMDFIFKFENDELRVQDTFLLEWIENVETDYNNGKLTNVLITLNPIPDLDGTIDKTRNIKVNIYINNEYEPIFKNVTTFTNKKLVK